MKDLFIRLRNFGKETIGVQNVQGLDRSCSGRILNTLSFAIVVIFLGLWIFTFLIIKDELFAKTLTGNMLTDLSCLLFFGGLVLSIFIGALVGNLLQRGFWKKWVRKKKD